MRSATRDAGRLLSQGSRDLFWLGYGAGGGAWIHRAAGVLHTLRKWQVRNRRQAELEQRLESLRARLSGRCLPTGGLRLALSDLSPELDEVCRPLRRIFQEIPLADIDQDGFLCARLGQLWPCPRVDVDAFLPRARFALTVVDHDGWVGVRKTFCGDKIAFVNELEAILDLRGAGCRVPEIFRVDFERLAITLAYINGVVIREALADAGAPMRDRDVKPSHSKLNRIQNYRLEKQRIAAGRSLIDRILDKETIGRLEETLLAIHRAHYALGDIKYGNIIVEATTKVPYFIDFEHALPLRTFSHATATYLRDCDAAKLNRLFGTKLMTAATAYRLRPAMDGAVYASFYAGTGIRRAIWHPHVARRWWWRMLARDVPIPREGRILDLGAGNGLNALQMLRAGAGEVIGVESDRGAIDQGLFFKRVFEWLDNAEYHFSYVRGSYADVRSMNLGKFDLITVFCTPCYANSNAVAKTVSDLARMTDTFVFRCNDERCIGRRDPDTLAKEQLLLNIDLVRNNGFPHVAVIERGGAGSALMIARKRAAANEDIPDKLHGRPRNIASSQRDQWVTSHPASAPHEFAGSGGFVSRERSVRRSRL